MKTKKDNRLHSAIMYGNAERVRGLLEDGIDPNVPDKNNQLPLESACLRVYEGDLSIIDLLLDTGAEINPPTSPIPPLHTAALTGRTNVVQHLIDRGANIHLQSKRQQTPLHYAAKSESADCVTLLLSLDAGVDVQDDEGETPLMSSAEVGEVRTAKPLLAAGADIHARNNKKQTPLMIGCIVRIHPFYVRTPFVELLIQSGAEIDAQDKNGYTALIHAIDNAQYESAQALLKAGADKARKNISGETVFDIAKKISTGDPDFYDNHGQDLNPDAFIKLLR